VNEADAADEAAVLPLPKRMGRYVTRVLSSPALAAHHSVVPVAVGLVEVDALVISSIRLDDAKVQALQDDWQHRPDDARLARICLPLAPAPAPAIEVRMSSDGGLTLVGRSHDLQCFEGPQLTWLPHAASSARARRGEPQEPVSGRVELRMAIGPSLPVLHAIRCDGRLLLRDGHHRALALRGLGLAYVPCLISACVHRDEVRALAPELAADELSLLFDSPRPPLLRDFNKPSLTLRLPVREPRCELDVQISLQRRVLS
jgi:hypothetical protein